MRHCIFPFGYDPRKSRLALTRGHVSLSGFRLALRNECHKQFNEINNRTRAARHSFILPIVEIERAVNVIYRAALIQRNRARVRVSFVENFTISVISVHARP